MQECKDCVDSYLISHLTISNSLKQLGVLALSETFRWQLDVMQCNNKYDHTCISVRFLLTIHNPHYQKVIVHQCTHIFKVRGTTSGNICTSPVCKETVHWIFYYCHDVCVETNYFYLPAFTFRVYRSALLVMFSNLFSFRIQRPLLAARSFILWSVCPRNIQSDRLFSQFLWCRKSASNNTTSEEIYDLPLQHAATHTY